MFTAKFLLVLVSTTVLFLRGEAAGAVCGQRSPFSTIQALPGKPGSPGPPGTVSDAVIEQLRVDILEEVRRELKLICPGDREMYPATSCKEIYECNSTAPSGYYWVNTTTGPLQVYCQMETHNCGDTTKGWMRVAHINMTSPEGTCPSPLETIVSPRSCSHAGGAGCSSVYFSTFGVPFTEVCGRAIGYQHYSADAFGVHNDMGIDDPYVDGLSITYYDMSSRQHLWTYAAGHSESGSSTQANCPCAAYSGSQPPAFVRDHYHCESGNEGAGEDQWYPDDPLWDGEGCPTGNTCCDPPNLPWFNRMIDPPSTADIELRLCHDESAENEDVSVELFELYVY